MYAMVPPPFVVYLYNLFTAWISVMCDPLSLTVVAGVFVKFSLRQKAGWVCLALLNVLASTVPSA